MNYLSVCSGIEAATVAWHPLGWKAVGYSEIDKFPSAVLAHHYPNTPNFGDMNGFRQWPDARPDVLVGGTPCQSFSVAGLRAGLADPRGNLMLTYLAIAARFSPRWLVWENVPGVLSSNGGRDFGTFLWGLGELGYGFAYRVLDAQYFNLAQRRARVFVVGCLGGWQRAAAVLFERASLSGHPAPSREKGQRVAAYAPSGIGEYREGFGTLRESGGDCGNGSETLIAPTLPSRSSADGGLGTDFDCDGGLISTHRMTAGTGRGTPIVPVVAPCLTQNYGKQPDNSDTSAGPMLVAFAQNQRGEIATSDTMGSLKVGGGKPGQGYPAIAFHNRQDPDLSGAVTHPRGAKDNGMAVAFQDVAQPIRGNIHNNSDPGMEARMHIQQGMGVRRLTPRECERLQGFPDDYTLIPYRGKPAADGPRYKALGNSMAVPCMHWIGERIAQVDAICKADEEVAA